MPAVSGIYKLLIATPEVTSKLSTYRMSTGAAKTPSIFTTFEVPDDTTMPYVIIQSATSASGGNSEDRGHIGGTSIVDVVLYDEKHRSSKAQRDTAMKIFETVHRATLTDDEYELWSLATPPVLLTDGSGFPGYVISCTVRLRELDSSGS